jgi:hypothetical protein
MIVQSTPFASIWIVVVAVAARPGECLEPQLVAATDHVTKLVVEIGMPALCLVNRPPYPTDADCLLVTIDGAALASVHLSLDWPPPTRIIDLMVEFRNITNERPTLAVGGLAGALLWFGLPTSGATGAIASPEQLRRRLAAASALFQAMCPSLDLGRALLRGRYLIAVANIEATGVPVDAEMVRQLRMNWPATRDRVISVIDREFGFYSGRRFDLQSFSAWLARQGISWPCLPSGQLDLSDDAFKEMARIIPDLRPIKELRATLTWFDPAKLAIGHDGRNRTPLRPFASRTGRNQPSAKASVLGSAKWVRHLIKPQAGMALAYIDWQQQEFGIAAALSEDRGMQAAYLSADPYMALAIAAKAAPQGATATSHPGERERFKACVLGVQYGMGAVTLGRRLKCSEQDAAALLVLHRKAFPRFWSWSDDVETSALLHRELRSTFGWRLPVGADTNPRSTRNFPMQANGAEMLRLACCLMTEAGITVCAPNHDAIMIEAPLVHLGETVAEARRLMAEASAVVLDGFALRTDVQVVRAPDRWTEDRGHAVWSALQQALAPGFGPAHQRDAT